MWRTLVPKKISNFIHGLKSAILAIFQKSATWLDWPCPVSAALQNCPQDFFFLFYIYIFIYFFEYKIRSSAWCFGHSDPDPSSVTLVVVIKLMFRTCNLLQGLEQRVFFYFLFLLLLPQLSASDYKLRHLLKSHELKDFSIESSCSFCTDDSSFFDNTYVHTILC